MPQNHFTSLPDYLRSSGVKNLEHQYSLPEDKNRSNTEQLAMGGTKAVISKHKGWMTIDLEA